MAPLRYIMNFVLYGNLLIAVCAAAFIWESYRVLGLPVQPLYMAVGFAATWFVYNADRLIPIKNLHAGQGERHKWISRNARMLFILSGLCALFLGIAVFYMPGKVVLFLAHLAALSLLYSIPFLRRGEEKRLPLRELPGLKIILITYVWMAATVWLPALSGDMSLLNKDVLLLGLERALFIFGITLPFDIRDFQADRQTGIKTIPGMIGIPASRTLAFASLAACALLGFVHYGPTSGIAWAKALTVLLTMILIYVLREDSHEYYFTGLLDGSMLLQAVLVALVVSA